MTHPVKKLSFILHEWELIRIRLDAFTDSLGPHRINTHISSRRRKSVVFDPGFPQFDWYPSCYYT